MKISRLILIPLSVLFFASCTDSQQEKEDYGPYDPVTGIGKFRNVELSPTLDADLIKKGEKIFNQKCVSCHKLSEELLVGPGLKDQTSKHSPEWILNYLTNTDQMVENDPEIQALIASGSPRMPDQNLSDDDAFALLEFFRNNDQKQNH